jgi:hypothetical protein
MQNTQQNSKKFYPLMVTFFGLVLVGALPILYMLYGKGPEDFDSSKIVDYILGALILGAYIYAYCFVAAILMGTNLVMGFFSIKQATSPRQRYIGCLILLLAALALIADGILFKQMTSHS